MAPVVIDDRVVSTAESGVLHVRFGKQVRTLGNNEVMTFGRGPECDLRIAHDPEDPVVSRTAGRVEFAGGRWVLHNSSRFARIILQPRPGAPVPVEPGQAVGLPTRRVHVQVLGSENAVHEIVLDGRAVAGSGGGPSSPAPGLPTAGPPDLSAPEVRLLAALCERLLTLAGAESRLATRREMARRLGVTPERVERRLADLRDRLIRAGVPDLLHTEEFAEGPAARLAGWALRYGVVTRADVDALDAPESDQE
ncbi:hypothetical protein [Actinomycetospora lemnae]|uniref:FHA domain-containing protein n=1 Tax=Actinomycetospora lemnae TaxID=3019891 RepID=A0ABT5SUN5_9PSEU|nr:hypothetical protein [Actinomycetospora sp. DW7H6]MDD7966562.1 hypothetical protein [Actinomycetospora sp. DW7H6]